MFEHAKSLLLMSLISIISSCAILGPGIDVERDNANLAAHLDSFYRIAISTLLPLPSI